MNHAVRPLKKESNQHARAERSCGSHEFHKVVLPGVSNARRNVIKAALSLGQLFGSAGYHSKLNFSNGRTHRHGCIRPGYRNSADGSRTILQMQNCQWLKPELVAQIEFVEWTPDGHLRHSRFGGLREDNDARQVVRE